MGSWITFMKRSMLCLGFVAVASVLVSGCATPLTNEQKGELMSYEAKGLEVKEKDPATGAALGILPGGGSFYTRNYGLGICNLLFWPLSVLWDPVSGYDGSEAINYYATKTSADNRLKKEISTLDDQLALGSISKEDYVHKKHQVEQQYMP